MMPTWQICLSRTPSREDLWLRRLALGLVTLLGRRGVSSFQPPARSRQAAGRPASRAASRAGQLARRALLKDLDNELLEGVKIVPPPKRTQRRR